jgi:hypothetical protein
MPAAVKSNEAAMQEAVIAAYEDLVWHSAQNADVPDDFAWICVAASKTVKDLAHDSEDIRRRIALQGEIQEYLTAKEKLAANEKKSALLEELAEFMRKHELRMSPIEQDIKSQKRRIDNTAKARQFYRATAPAWIKARAAKLQHRLAWIDRTLHEGPPQPPSDPDKLVVIVTDSTERASMRKNYEEQLARHETKLREYRDRNERLTKELPLRQSELAALEERYLELRSPAPAGKPPEATVSGAAGANISEE